MIESKGSTDLLLGYKREEEGHHFPRLVLDSFYLGYIGVSYRALLLSYWFVWRKEDRHLLCCLMVRVDDEIKAGLAG